jgi:tetratricopeptide (TPR) repeat protein
LALELPNLLAVFARERDARPELCVRAALALEPSIPFDGPFHVDSTRLAEVVELARRCGDPRLIARALSASALRGNDAGADERVLEAIRFARQANDPWIESAVILAAAFLAGAKQDLGESIRLCEEASALCRELGDVRGEAMALLLHAVAASHLEAPRVRERCRDAIALFQRAGDRRGEARALVILGAILGEGRATQDEARASLERGLAAARSSEDRASELRALAFLGVTLQDAERFEEAEDVLADALSLSRELGYASGEAAVRGSLAIIALERGRRDQARRHLGIALAIERELGNIRMECSLSAFFAAAEAEDDALAEAEARLARALETAPPPSDPGYVRDVIEQLEKIVDLARARAARRRDDPVGAADFESSARAKLADERARLRSERWSDLRFARRLLGRALEGYAGQAAKQETTVAVPIATQTPPLVLGPDAMWFRRGDDDRVLLARRDAVRRILARLVEGRVNASGVPIPLGELAESGWPGEKMLPKAASNRVYVALSQLRDLGLRDVLQTHRDGYLLDPSLPIVRA